MSLVSVSLLTFGSVFLNKHSRAIYRKKFRCATATGKIMIDSLVRIFFSHYITGEGLLLSPVHNIG